MALMKYAEFCKTFESGSAPDIRTVKSWIDNGTIYGKVYGPRSVYIDPDREPEKVVRTENPLVLRVLLQNGKNKTEDKRGAA